jgi:hypothetical protein
LEACSTPNQSMLGSAAPNTSWSGGNSSGSPIPATGAPPLSPSEPLTGSTEPSRGWQPLSRVSYRAQPVGRVEVSCRGLASLGPQFVNCPISVPNSYWCVLCNELH